MNLSSQKVGFEKKYEEQKIPEWYDLYLDYAHLKTLIGQTKLSIYRKFNKLIIDFREKNAETTRFLRN